MDAVVTRRDLRAELSDFARCAIREELVELRKGLLEQLRKEFQGHWPFKHDGRAEDESAVETPARSIVVCSEATHGALNVRMDVEEDAMANESSELLYEAVAESPQNRSRKGKETRAEVANTGARSFRAEGVEEGLQDQDASCVSSFCASILLMPAFDSTAALVVLANAVWIGMQTNHKAVTWRQEAPAADLTVDALFCIFFVAELLVRMLAKGCAFWTESGSKWNWFDFVVGGCQFAELFAHSGTPLQGLRALKLVRILRLGRIAEAFPELQNLISSIAESMHSLFWTLVFILLFLYTVSLLITEVVTVHKIGLGKEVIKEKQADLEEYFGTVDKTMLSLYMTLTSGISWVALLEPLELYVSPWMRLVFVLFIGFQLFAMLNIITACFVDNAMKLAVKAEVNGVMSSIWSILTHGDHSKNKDDMMISQADFEGLLDHPKMITFLELIGVESCSPDFVFGLIDLDGDGSLSADEFLRGCARLVGPAKSTEMARLASESKALLLQVDRAIAGLRQASQMQHTQMMSAITAELILGFLELTQHQAQPLRSIEVKSDGGFTDGHAETILSRIEDLKDVVRSRSTQLVPKVLSPSRSAPHSRDD